MVKVRKDLTGMVFGRLTVIEQSEDYINPTTGKHSARWHCRCSCANKTEIDVDQSRLTNGRTKSCGCLCKDRLIQRNHIRQKSNEWIDEIFKDEYGFYYVGFTSNTHKEFFVDAEDFDKIKDYCWFENEKYLVSYIDNKKVLMHQFLGFNGYDHKDRNPLNNRKHNLRQCTFQENMRNRGIFSNNTSGVTGISWNTTINKWHSYIRVDGRLINLGYFYDKEEAIKTRLLAEKKYFKKFAPQKHLYEQYEIYEEEED